MTVANVHFERTEANATGMLTKTATCTLTSRELLEYPVIMAEHASTQINLTLPNDESIKGCVNHIVAVGAAVVTVVSADGFGGAGDGSDTATLAQGEFVTVFSSGDDNFVSHNEPTG